jgi:formylglycine-generating enzyme required for sulfatase activity
VLQATTKTASRLLWLALRSTPVPLPRASTTEIYIAAAGVDRDDADALAALLGRRARVAVRGRFDAGADVPAETARTLETAGVFGVLLSRAGKHDAGLRAEVTAILEQVRRDPSRKVVPIYLDDDAERDRGAIAGLGSLQGLGGRAAGGLAAVADGLASLVRGLRAQWHRKATVAVVAVTAEIGDVQKAVVERFGRMSAVESATPIDAANLEASAPAEAADFRIVLVGGRTGGTETIAKLLEAGAAALKSARIDLDLVPDDEMRPAKAARAKITETFATADEAVARAQERFDLWLRDWAPRAPGKGALLEPWERAYLEVRLDKWEHGSYGGLTARAGRCKLERARLYVSLRAEPGAVHLDAEGRLVIEAPEAKRRGAPEVEALEKREETALRAPFLEQVLSHPGLPHLVLEGEAGAGKTVLLQHVAYALACRHLGQPMPEVELDLGGLEVGAPLLRIPVLIEAKRLAERVAFGEAGELCAALAAEIRQAIGDAALEDGAVGEGLQAGRYLLLVDSLDEVPTVEGRQHVMACLANATRRLGPCRIVLTTRPTAHTGVRVAGRGLRLVRVAALDEDATARMAARWTAAMGEDDAYRAELLAAITHVASRHPAEGDGSLVSNPLLLTCMMLVYDQQRLLPDSPAALFERMVASLCDAKPSPGFSSEAKREALERIFTSIQEAGGTARPAREIAEALLGARPDLRTVDAALDLLDRLAAETGVLRFETAPGPRGSVEQVARPWHRSFQQFLVARRMALGAESVTDATDRLFAPEGGNPARIDDPAWEGVLRFLLGVLAQRGSEAARAHVAQLLGRAMDPARAERRGRVLGLAAQGLAEYPDVLKGDPLREAVRDAVATSFAEDGARWPLADRLLALEALGRLGDPRLDGDPWVEIAGGTFTMGDGRSINSVPMRKEKVAPFRIFARPVTVQDYAAFVAADGYRDEAWWKAGRDEGEDVAEPWGWSEQRFHPNRPVMGASWYEATAFCAWASEAWAIEVDLPAEVEWEFAARGTEGAIYPWGSDDEPGQGDDARANHDWGDGGVRHATPVGAFPGGDRGRLLDLSGNVWEWCRDPWTREGRPETVDPTSLRGAPRVVRGGSWLNRAWNLRCAYRLGSRPGRRGGDLGFRVVCRGSRQT